MHLLFGFSPTACLSNLIRDIKRPATEWLREELKIPNFAWQEGYGAYTVSKSLIEKVQTYIAGQEAHHRRVTFQEEYLELLKLHGIEYDERYLW